MRKSFTPLFDNQSSFLKKNITDEELMKASDVFATSNIKPSNDCLRFIRDFSASLEIRKSKNFDISIFKN